MARWAAERATAEEIESIRTVLENLEKYHDQASKYVDCDLEFHMAIAKASHNEMLSSVLLTMQHVLRIWMEDTFKEARSTKHSMEMHNQIYTAIAAHDPEAAGKAMWIHTSGGALLAAAEQRYPGTVSPISTFNLSLSRGRQG